MGPLITDRHRETVESYAAVGVEEDGHLHTGGLRPAIAGYEPGYLYTSTTVEGLINNTRTCQEEIFDLVLVTMPSGDEDELIEQANDSVCVLAVGTWMRDYGRVRRIGRVVQAGSVRINIYEQPSISTPFGG